MLVLVPIVVGAELDGPENVAPIELILLVNADGLNEGLPDDDVASG